jgi:hypothetical protein
MASFSAFVDSVVLSVAAAAVVADDEDPSVEEEDMKHRVEDAVGCCKDHSNPRLVVVVVVG